MKSLRNQFAEIVQEHGQAQDPVLVPRSDEEAAQVIQAASTQGTGLLFTGAGSTLRALPGVHGCLVSSTGLAGIKDYRPDDLTISLGAGTTLAELESELQRHTQTAVLDDLQQDRTVGGVVASGASSYCRLRYGPTRNRVLGVTLVTGYGEVVHGGGQLVKNVTGFDLPRLVTGSNGELGLITSVTLKLWPTPPESRTILLDSPVDAHERLYKPLAILETEAGSFAFVEGSAAIVDHAASQLDGESASGLAWPADLTDDVVLSIRIPPKSMTSTVAVVRAAGAQRWIAQHGVGVIDAGWDSMDDEDLSDLRGTITALGGVVVVMAWPLSTLYDRWGVVPDSIAVQRRLKDLFDPDRVCNMGLLPGGL